MRTTRPLWHTLTPLIALGATVSFAAPHPVADACSIAAPSPVGAILGVAAWTESEDEVPRNAASLEAERGERFVSGGATLYRIPPDTSAIDVDGLGLTIPVSADSDTAAPSVTLEGAAWVADSACGGCAYGGTDTSYVTLTVSAEDEMAAAERITYAVYFGATEDAAREASQGEPELWVLPSTDGVWFFLAAEEVPGFIVVRAFDQAGNASDASAAVTVTR